MKKQTLVLINGFLLVASLGVLAGLYIGLKQHPGQQEDPKILRYRERMFEMDSSIIPEAIEKIEAQYPESALKKRVEGIVKIAMIINNDGIVTASWITHTEFSGTDYKSRADLVAAAVEAAKKWKFKPVEVFGKQRGMFAIIPFTFKLDSVTSTR